MGDPGEKGDPGDPAGLDPNLTPLEKLIAGQGGEEAIMALTTVELSMTGFRSVIDETFLPSDPPLVATTFSSTTAVSVPNQLMRMAYTKQNGIFGPTFTPIEYIRGNLGHIQGVESVFGFPAGDMISERWASTIKTQTLLNPYWFALAAVTDPQDFEEAGVALVDGVVHHVLSIDADPVPIFVYVNARNGLMSAVETMENDHLRGDVKLAVYYLGWQEVGEIRMPTEVYLAIDDEIVHGERRTSLATNTAIPADTFEFPAGANPQFDQEAAERGFASSQFHQMFAHAIGIPLDAEQLLVTPTEISPDVFLLAGGTHHSMAIAQTNGVVVLEAPLNEARSEAVLAWVATQFPGQQVTHLVVSHHHSDHTGGVRRFAAEGATIVVNEATADFFIENLREARTVLPDELTRNPVDFAIEIVPAGGSFEIPDAEHPVFVYPVATSHAADMMTAYLPNEGLVFQSDLFSPGNPIIGLFLIWGTEYAQALVDLGIDVTTVAGGHGNGVVTYDQFRTALGL